MLQLATALAVLAVAQTTAGTPGAGAPTTVNWLHQPTSREMASCMTPLLSGGGVATINLQCRTMGEGRVARCKVTENTQSADPRYEQAAICAAKFFRIETTDETGHAVLGVPVNIPFRLEPPHPKAE